MSCAVCNVTLLCERLQVCSPILYICWGWKSDGCMFNCAMAVEWKLFSSQVLQTNSVLQHLPENREIKLCCFVFDYIPSFVTAPGLVDFSKWWKLDISDPWICFHGALQNCSRCSLRTTQWSDALWLTLWCTCNCLPAVVADILLSSGFTRIGLTVFKASLTHVIWYMTSPDWYEPIQTGRAGSPPHSHHWYWLDGNICVTILIPIPQFLA